MGAPKRAWCQSGTSLPASLGTGSTGSSISRAPGGIGLIGYIYFGVCRYRAIARPKCHNVIQRSKIFDERLNCNKTAKGWASSKPTPKPVVIANTVPHGKLSLARTRA